MKYFLTALILSFAFSACGPSAFSDALGNYGNLGNLGNLGNSGSAPPQSQSHDRSARAGGLSYPGQFGNPADNGGYGNYGTYPAAHDAWHKANDQRSPGVACPGGGGGPDAQGQHDH